MLKVRRMTRLEVLTEKRYELVNQLIELKTWQIGNPQANAAEAIKEIETQLDELGRKIERLRMDK